MPETKKAYENLCKRPISANEGEQTRCETYETANPRPKESFLLFGVQKIS